MRFVMDQEMDLASLISHRFPLSGSIEALQPGCPSSTRFDENRDPTGQLVGRKLERERKDDGRCPLR